MSVRLVRGGAVLLAVACTLPDPVHDRAVERLGPETSAGANSFHRAGQPCALCHNDGAGPASSDFSIAGTVFAGPASTVGVEGAEIAMVDALGTSPPKPSPVVTNCVGNFWVRRVDWNPTFPVRVTVSKGGARRPMTTEIGRAASCAECHEARVPVSNPLAKVVPVWIEDPGGPSKTCPVDPEASRR